MLSFLNYITFWELSSLNCKTGIAVLYFHTTFFCKPLILFSKMKTYNKMITIWMFLYRNVRHISYGIWSRDSERLSDFQKEIYVKDRQKKKIPRMTNHLQPETVKYNISVFQESTFVTWRKYTSWKWKANANFCTLVIWSQSYPPKREHVQEEQSPLPAMCWVSYGSLFMRLLSFTPHKRIL